MHHDGEPSQLLPTSPCLLFFLSSSLACFPNCILASSTLCSGWSRRAPAGRQRSEVLRPLPLPTPQLVRAGPRSAAGCGHSAAAQSPRRCLSAPPVRLGLLHLPGPGGYPLTRWSAVLLRDVVRRSCQGHTDAELLVPPSTSQPSLTQPPSGTRCAINIHLVDGWSFTGVATLFG